MGDEDVVARIVGVEEKQVVLVSRFGSLDLSESRRGLISLVGVM